MGSGVVGNGDPEVGEYVTDGVEDGSGVGCKAKRVENTGESKEVNYAIK